MRASAIEDGGAAVATSGTVDEVQELIGRAEEILNTLKELDDASYDRLRLKLNAIVSLVRDTLVEDGASSRPGRNPTGRSFRAIGLAMIGGFVIGLAVGRALARHRLDGAVYAAVDTY